MRRFASVVALLLLLSAAGPVLACMTGTSMTPQESACCRAMHRQCGEMANMGCCRVEARRALPQIATSPVLAVLTHWVVVTQQVIPVADPSQFAASATFHNPPNEYPPGLVAAETTVLRI